MDCLEHQQLEEIPTVETLTSAANYFPLVNGRYEIKPGLYRFGTDFGNSEADQKVFQVDESFECYQTIKQQVRKEQLSKYFQMREYSDEVATIIARFIIDRLAQEYPQYFELRTESNVLNFHNHLTQEILVLNSAYQLQSVSNQSESFTPAYISTLDALANQIQEDVTVVSRQNNRHWISAIHLCFPNHWSAEAKIGRNFACVHESVAGMTAMNQRGDAIVHTMITHKPAVRFAWGLSTDTRLNHHPTPPDGIPRSHWHGRNFEPTQPRLYLRIERQVVWGFPEVDAALFTIRTSFRDCDAIKQNAEHRSQLISAIRSMSSESLAYKGLTHSRAIILEWLEEA